MANGEIKEKIFDERKIRLVTYKPLCYTLLGIEAIKNSKLNPFIDYSCRREPDLEHKFPSISSLCRNSKLAPHLKKNDIVIYLSVPRKYKASECYLNKNTYKLVAILKVLHTCKNHEEAKEWYSSKHLPIPSNCMVKGSHPVDFSQTGGNFKNQREIINYLNYNQNPKMLKRNFCRRLINWDAEYQKRANDYPQFNITEVIYNEINSPIEVLRSDLIKWFDSLPRTQTPKIVNENQFENFMNLVPDKENLNRHS